MKRKTVIIIRKTNKNIENTIFTQKKPKIKGEFK